MEKTNHAVIKLSRAKRSGNIEIYINELIMYGNEGKTIETEPPIYSVNVNCERILMNALGLFLIPARNIERVIDFKDMSRNFARGVSAMMKHHGIETYELIDRNSDLGIMYLP